LFGGGHPRSIGSVMFELEINHSGTLGRVKSACPESTTV
jgi:hypothetical protein